MIKKTVIALSLLVTPIIACAIGGGASIQNVSDAFRRVKPTAEGWAALTAGTNQDYSIVGKNPANTRAWTDILNATDFASNFGVSISDAVNIQFIYYIRLRPRVNSSPNGPMIELISSNPNAQAWCELESESGAIFYPTFSTRATLMPRVYSPNTPARYSAYPMFPLGGVPNSNQVYELLCGGYEDIGGTITPINARDFEFDITW